MHVSSWFVPRVVFIHVVAKPEEDKTAAIWYLLRHNRIALTILPLDASSRAAHVLDMYYHVAIQLLGGHITLNAIIFRCLRMASFLVSFGLLGGLDIQQPSP